MSIDKVLRQRHIGMVVNMSKFPFSQIRLNENSFIRTFSSKVNPSELVWHRDKHERLVEVISGNDWKIQLENEVPKVLKEGDVFTITAERFHRLVRGHGDLVLIIKEEKKSSHPSQYSAPEGSKRDKQLDQTKKDLASGDPERVQRAYRRRERMEKQEREKKGFKNKPRKDSQKESAMKLSESKLRKIIRRVIQEELSAKTKKTLKNKAEERGLTVGSVEAEYKKGLAAWASSGSRKGMSQHQWAMARVNSAQPSKSWAVVKKSKAKKKK